MRYETVKKLTGKDFKRSIGVSLKMFGEMLEVIKNELRNFGRPAKLSREEQLLLTLMYLREYRTEFHIGLTYGVSESTVCRTIKKIENVLIKSDKFHLPGKKVLRSNDTLIETALIDAAEQKIERPKKKQRQYYSGKKKCHTQKAQLMVNPKSQEVICTDFSKGKKHDFQLFKESRSMMSPDICGVGDTGYQGLASLHQNSQTPVKKSKRRPLTKEQKLNNRKLARERILVEHVIRRLKIFRILKECYRNRRKRFALRFNLIAAIHNLELNLIL